jgi:hypothetical protein
MAVSCLIALFISNGCSKFLFLLGQLFAGFFVGFLDIFLVLLETFLDEICLNRFEGGTKLVTSLDLLGQFVEISVNPDISQTPRENVVQTVQSLHVAPFLRDCTH